MRKNTKLSVVASLWIFAPKANQPMPHRKAANLPFDWQKINPYLALLFLYLATSYQIAAQEHKGNIVKQGINIGEKVPEVVLKNLHGYQDDHGKVVTATKLSSFKGKFLILDFWASWCSPCVAMFPKMDSLQLLFKTKVQFISVTYQSENEVLPLLAKLNKTRGRPSSVPHLFADQELNKLFPHAYLPHYVWINEDGIVAAITDAKAINAKEINQVLANKSYKLKEKKDYKVAYDQQIPLFYNGNGGDGSTELYHTMLSNYVDGIGCGLIITPPTVGKQGFSKILVKNLALMNLFATAIGAGKKFYSNGKILIETKDSLIVDPVKMGENWRPYVWSYEMKLPAELQVDGYQLMYDDLSRLFKKYTVKLEKRLVTCYALKKIEGKTMQPSISEKKLVENGPNGLQLKKSSLNLFINALEVYYFYNSAVPIVNLTDYPENVDIEISAPSNDVLSMNSDLQKYGLEFVKGKFEVDMIVFKDAKN